MNRTSLNDLPDTEKENRAHQRMLWTGAESFSLEASKTMLLLNAGGIVAMLGFSQALVGKGAFSSFKMCGLSAGGFFVLGACCIFFALERRWRSRLAVVTGDGVKSVKAGQLADRLMYASFFLFVMGSLAAGIGVAFLT